MATTRQTRVRPVVLAIMLVFGMFAAVPASAVAQSRGIQISGGLDARYTPQRDEGDDLRLQGAFLNLRKVWSDDAGDRWIAVAQADADDNFTRIRPYQAYVQYKGPLGKWNVRAGHFLLPFGLLATYDTERLILRGLEETSLGIRKDTGAQVLGRFGDWDYAVAVTDGLSDVRFRDSHARPVLTSRLAYVKGEFQVGASVLIGNVLLDPEFNIGTGFVSERRAGIDLTKSFGPLTLRGEALGGTDDGRGVGGGIVLADYALTPKLEINIRYANWYKSDTRQFIGAGFTYQLRPGLFARAADNYEFGRNYKNAFTIQLYYQFSKLF